MILSSVMRFIKSMNSKNIAGNEKIDALEKRVNSLETGLKYCNVWRDSEKYQPNNFVTWGGSLWCAKIENIGTRPGTADGVWKLAVKHGRDGKDQR